MFLRLTKPRDETWTHLTQRSSQIIFLFPDSFKSRNVLFVCLFVCFVLFFHVFFLFSCPQNISKVKIFDIEDFSKSPLYRRQTNYKSCVGAERSLQDFLCVFDHLVGIKKHFFLE